MPAKKKVNKLPTNSSAVNFISGSSYSNNNCSKSFLSGSLSYVSDGFSLLFCIVYKANSVNNFIFDAILFYLTVKYNFLKYSPKSSVGFLP